MYTEVYVIIIVDYLGAMGGAVITFFSCLNRHLENQYFLGNTFPDKLVIVIFLYS